MGQNNIKKVGVATYTLTKAGLEAKWHIIQESELLSGSGRAIRKSGNNPSFEGDFKITYYDDKQNELGTYIVSITKVKTCYDLLWTQNDKKTHHGLGSIKDDVLHFGYLEF